MQTLSTTLEWLQNVTYLAVGVWALLRWRRQGDQQSGWLAATFGSLAFAVIVGAFTRDMEPSTALDVITRINVTVLLPFPYYLLRFLDSFEPVSTRLRRVIGVGSVVIVAAALALPRLLDPELATSTPNRLFTLTIVTVWVVALAVVARRFWRAGAGQPTLVRRRLRTLSLASTSLSIAIVVSGANPGGESDPFTLAMQVLAVVSSGLFLLGFAPPGLVKTYWRQPEERGLHMASVALMQATDPQEVADILVPHMRAVIAAQGVALVHDGHVVAASGVTAAQRRAAAAGSADSSNTFPISSGAIHVWANLYTPFFGQEEEVLLGRLALLADLAIDRASLFALERDARVELEAANAELESFVYSASHDLKSPLIALQSYVDVLSEEYSASLDDQGRWFLERMRSNCKYMEALVGDLLELSRVGRVETLPSDVDLGELVTEVATEVQHRHPEVEVTVGELPHVWLNELRARQLVRNLMENAAVHGRSAAVRIEVRSEPSTELEGGVVLYVRDDGVGVPAAYRERVFGVFERLEAETEGSTGTGIGLAICRKIAESAGGRIWLTDHEDGAEFAVLFPPETLQVPTGTASTPTSHRTEVPA